jgi:uroporphyrinogen-III decarboxylase
MPGPTADPLAALQEGTARARRGAQGLADRPPVYAQISHHSARLAGESTVEFFRNARTFLRSELAADLFYAIDGPTIHYDVYNIEAEALGARLLWSEAQVPAFDPHRPLLDSADAHEKLRPVKPGRAGRMPYALEINARLRDLGLEPKVRFTGPISLAAALLGLEGLILAIQTEPQRVHALMRFLTREVVAPWIACQREGCGGRQTATGSDALASPPLLSVEMVREFCLGYIEELERLVGGIRLAGVWGESCTPEPRRLLDIKAAGSPGSIQVLDPDVSALGPAFFRAYAQEKGLSLVMGLDASLVGSGSLGQIRSRARRFIEEGGRNGKFVLFINDVPFDAPPESVRAVVSTACEYRVDAAGCAYVRAPAGPREPRWPTLEQVLGAVDQCLGPALSPRPARRFAGRPSGYSGGTEEANRS